MNASRIPAGLKPAMMALAIAGVFGAARAQDVPEESGASVTVGAGHASGEASDRTRFGMYNGFREHGTRLLFDFSYQNRAPSGTWMGLSGRNLTLDNRELAFSWRRIGDMKVTADYSEITRHDPRTINTSLAGAGTTTPTVTLLATPGTGQDLNLALKRKGLGIAAEAWVSNRWSVEASFRNEEKTGSRFWGTGFVCSANWRDVGICSGTSAGAVLMLPEPVDSSIKQAEAKVNYAGERLHLSFGYYGSFYTNGFGSLRPTIGLTAFGNQNGGTQAADAGLNTVMGNAIALWPDNESHQLSVAGNYRLAPKTRLTFKYAYIHATQNETFASMGLGNAPVGRASLGGILDTTRAQLGFSTAPLDKLHVHGDFVYEDKSNKTPIDRYNVFYTCPGTYNAATRTCSTAWGTGSFTNGNAAPTRYHAKLEASYKLTPQYLAVLGVKYEDEDFGTWTPTDLPGGVSGLKQKLNEKGYRAELRRTVSETFTGSIAYEASKREGKSPWLLPANFTTGANTGVSPVSDAAIFNRTAIFPFIYMDRERDKLRFLGNWTPTDRLSLQLFADRGHDKYSGPTDHGLRKFNMSNLALDASYQLSDAWKLSAYGSRGQQTVEAGHSTGYDADLKDTASAFGVGARGALTGQLRVGADFMWLRDVLKYNQVADPAASATNASFLAASGGLPDVTYRLNRLNLYGEYALLKNASVRLDYIRHATSFDEWTYSLNGVPFLYSDNTTLRTQETQRVYFVAASFVYRFQ